jgi:hypothetical protein
MPIPAASIVTGFKELEARLKSFLEKVPFVPQHESVWSPYLATCLIDTCSQLDSLWKAIAGRGAGNLDIRDHFVSRSKSVVSRWVIIWGDEVRQLNPFVQWPYLENPTVNDYRPIPWWQAYNDLKHERWENIAQATLGNAANALAALFLAIIRCRECQDAIQAAGWIHTSFAIPYALLELDRDSPTTGVTVESELLSYAAGSCNEPNFLLNLGAFHECTHRFGRWLENRYGRTVLLG